MVRTNGSPRHGFSRIFTGTVFPRCTSVVSSHTRSIVALRMRSAPSISSCSDSTRTGSRSLVSSAPSGIATAACGRDTGLVAGVDVVELDGGVAGDGDAAAQRVGGRAEVALVLARQC